MPRERFTDEYLKKFNIQHGTPQNDRRRGTNRAWALTTSRGFPAKSVRVSHADWVDIIELVGRHRYRLPSEYTGLAGEHVRLFGEALARGLGEEKLTDPVREAATKVLDFVRGPAREGFLMQSQWS